MKHLVLGGAGFIGQHLTHTLLKTTAHSVVVIDNLATSRFNPALFAHYGERFRMVKADLIEMDDVHLTNLCRGADKIWHLAGSVGVELIDKEPSKTLFNNMKLTNKLLPIFQTVNKHVVFSSTSEIYGEGPFNEESNASIGPSSKLRWGYATAKLMTEFLFRASEFPFTIVRFFNVVGPAQLGDYGMVLPRFIAAAEKGDPLIVYGDGKQIRSFCHIRDAIDALIKVSEFDGELFNIGNEQPITIEQLAKQVIEVLGSKSTIQKVPYNQAFSQHHGDIIRRVPDLSKIRKFIKYRPQCTLDDIIMDMA